MQVEIHGNTATGVDNTARKMEPKAQGAAIDDDDDDDDIDDDADESSMMVTMMILIKSLW